MRMVTCNRKELDETNPLSKLETASDSVHWGSGNHGEGLLVRLRIWAALSMTLGILATTIWFAGPVMAAPTTWVMPDVRGSVLQRAVSAVEQATSSAELDLRLIDSRNGQEVINKSNWVVCYERPAAGSKISQKTKRVYLYVKRFNQESCWS